MTNPVEAKAAAPESQDPIRIVVNNWTSQNVLAEVAGKLLQKMGYSIVPSETNFVMIDLRREVRPVIGALREKQVHVGRLFPAMPKHLRVTIGTPEEMHRLQRVEPVAVLSNRGLQVVLLRFLDRPHVLGRRPLAPQSIDVSVVVTVPVPLPPFVTARRRLAAGVILITGGLPVSFTPIDGVVPASARPAWR